MPWQTQVTPNAGDALESLIQDTTEVDLTRLAEQLGEVHGASILVCRGGTANDSLNAAQGLIR